MAEEKDVKQEKKVYTYQDLIKFSNLDIYSGFGEIKESVKPTAPKYSFGTSTRDAEPKKFQNKEMARIDCYGTPPFTQENRLPRDPTTTSMINSCIRRGPSTRSALSLATLSTPRPSTSTTSARTSMYKCIHSARHQRGR